MEAPAPPTGEVPAAPPGAPASARRVALVSALAVFGLFLTLGAFTQWVHMPFGVWFSQVLIFLGASWTVVRVAGHSPVRFAGLQASGVRLLALGFGLGVANFFALVAPLQFFSQQVLPESWRDVYDVAMVFENRTPLELALVIGAVTLAAPLCEEFFFRGVLQRGLMPPTLPPPAAVGVTALVFAALHFNPIGVAALLELGVLFGLLRWRTGSLWPAVGAHAANNVISTALYFAARQAGEPPPDAEAPPQAVLAMGLVGGAAMWMALRRAYASGVLSPPDEGPGFSAALPAPPLWRAAAPWSLAATLAILAVALVDRRGIELNVIDARHPLRPLPEDAPDALHAERRALRELRARARRGEVSFGEYVEERRRLASERAPVSPSVEP